MPTRIAITGAAGRMGQQILRIVAGDDRFVCAAALESTACSALGQDAGTVAGTRPLGVALAPAPAGDFDVLIDFSTPEGTEHWLAECERRGRPIVIGTTGYSEVQLARISAAAKQIAVLRSANMSLGVNVLLAVVEQVAAKLGPAYDVEIVESHHRFKQDAPGGTALAFYDAAARGRGGATQTHGRSGAHALRKPGEIGLHSIRGGDVVGEHEVRFVTLGETVAIRHLAHARETFARGALRAAEWIAHKPAGAYTMADVLGLK